MNRHTVISLAIAAMLSACGGSSQSASSTGTTTTTQASTGGEQHSAQEEHHPQLTPAQHAMHEVLAPIWHSEANAARDTRACEQAATLRQHAGSVQSEAAPANAPANTAELRSALVAAAEALVTECAGSRANVTAKLTDLHSAFHHVFEAR